MYCTKRSCYNTKPTQVIREVEEEEQDPRHKPGASLLDVLGLVKKKNITTKERTSTDTEIQKRRSIEEPSELVWKSSGSTTQPAEQKECQGSDGIPSELKGATKWKTVKIKDPSTPSKASVFLGASDESPKDLETTKDPKEQVDDGMISIKKEKIDSNEDSYSASAADDHSEEKLEDVSGHDEDSLKVTIETDIQSDEETDMEDRLISQEEAVDGKSENSLLDIKRENVDDDSSVEEEMPSESGELEEKIDTMSDSVLDTSGALKEENTEKEEEFEEENEAISNSVLNTSDNVEEDITAKEDMEEGELALVKEPVSEDAEDNSEEGQMKDLQLPANQTVCEKDVEKKDGEQSKKTLEGLMEDSQNNQNEDTGEKSEEMDVLMDSDEIAYNKDENASREQEEGGKEDPRKEEERKAEAEGTAEVEDDKKKPSTEQEMEDGGGKSEKTEQGQSKDEERQLETEKGSSETVSTEKGQDQGALANAESDSLVKGGTKDSSKADNSDVAEKEESSRDKPTEDTERRSSTQSRRPDDSHHHHDNRSSSGRSDHRVPHRDHRGPTDNRGWSRTERSPHENRDNYRHHGQNRNYEDRHQYDRNRHDNRRHGYPDNRHTYHDHRYGYDNRSSRGHLRGQGYYRGGYRDYR